MKITISLYHLLWSFGHERFNIRSVYVLTSKVPTESVKVFFSFARASQPRRYQHTVRPVYNAQPKISLPLFLVPLRDTYIYNARCRRSIHVYTDCANTSLITMRTSQACTARSNIFSIRCIMLLRKYFEYSIWESLFTLYCCAANI